MSYGFYKIIMKVLEVIDYYKKKNKSNNPLHELDYFQLNQRQRFA